MMRRSYYADTELLTSTVPVLTAMLNAVEGIIPWTCEAKPTPKLIDIALSGHAYIEFDGVRSDKTAKCVGCHAETNRAWRISPIDFTVAACCGDCVADRVEKEWSLLLGAEMFLRRRGKVATIGAKTLGRDLEPIGMAGTMI